MPCGLNGRGAQYGKDRMPASRVGSCMWYVSLAAWALEAQGPAENHLIPSWLTLPCRLAQMPST